MTSCYFINAYECVIFDFLLLMFLFLIFSNAYEVCLRFGCCFDVLFLTCMLVFGFFLLSQVFAFVCCVVQFVTRSRGNSSWMVVFRFLCCGILVHFILEFSLLASPFQVVSFFLFQVMTFFFCFDVLFLTCMLVFCFFVLSQVFAFVCCVLQFVVRSQGNSSWMVVFRFLCCGILVHFILELETKMSFFPLCLLLHFKL